MEQVRVIYIQNFGVEIEKLAGFGISGAETSGCTPNKLVNIHYLYLFCSHFYK
jgi:hypothetical protein